MKIGIIADTHIPVSAPKIPPKVFEHFKDCDLIVHAGDLVEMSVLGDLEKIAETKAVWGNMDGADVRKSLPEKIEFKVDKITVGVVHGKGSASKIVDMVKKTFDKKPDIIIFGHSHAPYNKNIDGTLYFNPGSSTDRIFSPYRSIGIIEIDGNDIRAEIIRLDD
ncbi:MAG: metallophosphoesterase family protein [Candidatus Omnitrophota bacterium]